MQKEFIPYELALALNKLGCKLFINYVVQDEQEPYPTIEKGILWQQAFDWLRDKCDLHCVVDEYENPKSWGYLINNDDLDEAFNLRTYEEARLACLEKLIELCEKN